MQVAADKLNNNIRHEFILSIEGVTNSTQQNKREGRDCMFMPNKFPPLYFILDETNRVPNTIKREETFKSILLISYVMSSIIREERGGSTSNKFHHR